MPDYQPQSNNISPFQAPKKLDYDLDEEKREIAEEIEEIKKDLLTKWKKSVQGAQIFPSALGKLNPEARDFLLSFSNTLFYNTLAKNFQLNQKQRDLLPKIVWQVCLQNSFSELKTALSQNLDLQPSMADQISAQINQTILLKVQTFLRPGFAPTNSREDERSRIVKMSIADALEKNPKLGEQLLTANHITLNRFAEPVRPSINNWLSDYTFNLGTAKHDAMERGTYLFQSANGQQLSAFDRQKLAQFFKLYEENTPLDVDLRSQLIIFPELEKTPPKRDSISSGLNAQPLPKEREKIRPIPQPVTNWGKAEIAAQKKAQTPPSQTPSPKRDIASSGLDAQPSPQRKPEVVTPRISLAQHQNPADNIGSATFSSPQKLAFEKKQTETPKNLPPKPQTEQNLPQRKGSLSDMLSHSHQNLQTPTQPRTPSQPFPQRVAEAEGRTQKNQSTAPISQGAAKKVFSLGDQIKNAKNTVNLREEK